MRDETKRARMQSEAELFFLGVIAYHVEKASEYSEPGNINGYKFHSVAIGDVWPRAARFPSISSIRTHHNTVSSINPNLSQSYRLRIEPYLLDEPILLVEYSDQMWHNVVTMNGGRS